MKHVITRKERSAVEIKMVLTKEEVTPIKEAAIKEISKTAEVKGFQKGKAPADAIVRDYGKHIDEEIVETTLKAHYDSVLAAEDIKPVSFIYNLTTAKKDGEFEITFTVDEFPSVKLGNYKGLSVEKREVEFKEENLTAEIDALVNRKASLVDAEAGYKAAMGDNVDLAFDGSIDGVPFDGGKADSHQLVLGSKMFIDNFEDQLVGYTAGQEGEVNVTFPENYGHAPLAGKVATFKVKINSIQKNVTPELNDEFAKELGFESVADLKAKKKEEIIAKEEMAIKNDTIGKLLQTIAESTEISIPNSMIAREVENKVKEMDQHLAMQGANIDMYLKMMGKSKEEMMREMAPMAENKVKSDIILDEIARAENLVATPEDMALKMSEIAKMYGMDTAKLEEELNKQNSIDSFKENLNVEIMLDKAVNFILTSAK